MFTKNQTNNSSEKIKIDSPMGPIVISAKDGVVTGVDSLRGQEINLPSVSEKEPVLNLAAKELKEYFAGERKTFSFPMVLVGTPFQKSVWNALLQIPYGETRTYGEIAKNIDNPKASRAVGMACNKNPIMIAVPCHRVIGADGSLTGYAPGTNLKQIVLDLERKKSVN